MQVKELSLEVQGLKVAGKIWNANAETPVLALHGWLDNAATFDRLAPLLPELRIAAIDLAGHGASSHRHMSASYEFCQWIPEIAATAEALGWRRYAVMGHSLGGAIALCLAAVQPERVTKVVALDSLGPLARGADEAPTVMASAINERGSAEVTLRKSVFADLEVAVKRLRKHNPHLTAPAARALAERGTQRMGDLFTWSFDPRARNRSLVYLTEDQVQAFLKRVSCPTLIVRPRDGWPFHSVAERLKCIPQARVHHVEGAHHVHLTHPERVSAEVRQFLLSPP